MNTVLLSLRLQNILAIWAMVLVLFIVAAGGAQLYHRFVGGSDNG